jgi:transcriptional regulator with XRE-family HTH domain
MPRPEPRTEGTLGHWIERQRDRAGMTQGELANACDTLGMKNANQGEVSRWERNVGKPSVEQVRAIVTATGGTSTDLSEGLSLRIGLSVAVLDDDTAAVA